MSLSVERTIEARTNSVAVSPSGSFVTYIDAGIVVDDGRRRLFRGSAKRVHRVDAALIRAATDRAVVFTTVNGVSVVDIDGKVTDLAKASKRHAPTHLHTASNTLTTVVGAIVTQWDTETWKEKLRVDVAEDLDVSGYIKVAADEEWIVLSTGGRIVLLTAAGELETELPSAGRESVSVGAGSLLSVRLPSASGPIQTVLHSVPHDIETDVWPEQRQSTWCSSVREFRGVIGDDVVIRTPLGTPTRHHGPQTASPQMNFVEFADRAPVAVSWRRDAAKLSVLRW